MVSPTIGDAFGQEKVMRLSAEGLAKKGAEIYFLGDIRGAELPKCAGFHLVPGLSSLHSLSRRIDVVERHGRALTYLDEVRPDVVHLIDQFDYRFNEALCLRYPVVLTAHTVAPTCPSSTRLLETDAVCQRASGWTCLVNHHREGCLGYLKNDLRRVHALQNYRWRRRSLKKVRRIIAISRYLQTLLAHDGWPPSKIELVYNPVEVPVARPAPMTGVPAGLFVCASRLVKMKGIDHLLRALAALAGEQWTLWICGEGPERAALEQLSVKLGIAERVCFLGRLAGDRLASMLMAARALVQPNLGPEGFGLSVAEACALGVPVVAYGVPALDEIVVHEHTGLLAVPRDIESLTVQLRRVLRDDVLVAGCRRLGPKWVSEHFSPEAHITATWRVYESAMRSAGEP